MFGPSSSEKEAQARAGSIQDVEAYFKQIRNVIKRYKKLVLDLDEIKKDKKKVEKRMELIVSSFDSYAMLHLQVCANLFQTTSSHRLSAARSRTSLLQRSKQLEQTLLF